MNFTGTIKPVNVGRIVLYQGATFSKQFTWKLKNEDTGESEPVDLTGATVLMQVRKYVSSPILLDFSPFITIPVPTNGTFNIDIPATDTEAMSFDEGVFQVEVHFPSSTVVRIIEGVIELSPEVVR